MLRDKYEQDKFFMDIQTLASEMDAALTQLDQVLEDDEIFQRVKHDMSRRHRDTPRTGRPSSPVEMVLRMLVVKHLYNWSYEQTEQHVKDSLVLRRFCRIYFEDVPDDTTLIRWAGVIQPETLAALNERVVIAGLCWQADLWAEAAHRWHGGGDEYPLSDRQQPAEGWSAGAQSPA